MNEVHAETVEHPYADRRCAALLDQVAAAVHTAPPRLGHTVLVVIDGPSGSGKSAFAARLHELVGGTLVSTDDFATWEDPFTWWPRLVDGVLEPFRRGEPGGYRAVEWSDGAPAPGRWRSLAVPRVLLLEGVSAARRAAAELAALTVWLRCGTAEDRLARTVARDGEDQRANLARWQRIEAGWFAVDRPDLRAEYHL